MTTPKHTPGPWQASRMLNVTGIYSSSIFKGEKGICVTAMDDANFSDFEADANTKLIAAAPDMYEALKPFANYACDDWESHECPNCKAKQALAKVEGR